MSNLRASRDRMCVSRIHDDLPLGIHEPKRDGDVGWDLEAMEDIVIPPMTAVDVPVNARIALPHGVWAEIRSRSSIARRNLQVDAGTIDNGYRGPLFVLVRNMQLPTIRHDPEYNVDEPHQYNYSRNTIQIKAGERVGQLVFYRMQPIWMEEIEVVDTQTDRGTAGFGSTGR